ncbi:hypothetical protein [Rarobacter faecitabidus]|nr:hypothetical protein [Rarobacter faecitabidus]
MNHPPPTSSTDLSQAIGDLGGVVEEISETQHAAGVLAGDVSREVIAALPSGLRSSITVGPVRAAVSQCLGRGWTAAGLLEQVRARSWAGAGGGAVVAWLRDLAAPETAADIVVDKGPIVSAWAVAVRRHPGDECPHGLPIEPAEVTAGGVVKCPNCRREHAESISAAQLGHSWDVMTP